MKERSIRRDLAQRFVEGGPDLSTEAGVDALVALSIAESGDRRRTRFAVVTACAPGSKCGGNTGCAREDHGETDTDCGGPNCGKCANGDGCSADGDCQPGNCCDLQEALRLNTPCTLHRVEIFPRIRVELEAHARIDHGF